MINAAVWNVQDSTRQAQSVAGWGNQSGGQGWSRVGPGNRTGGVTMEVRERGSGVFIRAREGGRGSL